MKQTVQAGTLADFGSLIRKISDVLFTWMDKLNEWGASASKPTKDADGNLSFDLDTDDHKYHAHVVLVPEEGEDNIYDIEITPKDAAKETINGVPAASISKRLNKWMTAHQWDLDNDTYDDTEDDTTETTNEDVNEDDTTEASTNLRFSLKKVTSNTQTNVVLVSITGSTNMIQADGIIKDVVANDEFCATLTEVPQVFEACPCADGTLEVNPCEETVQTAGTYAVLMAMAVNLWSDLKTMHWNAVGDGFFDLHEKMDEYINAIQYDIDVLGELSMEYDNFAPNPVAAAAGFGHVTIAAGYTEDVGFEIARQKIMEFVTAMQCASVNFPSDVQAELAGHIRYWRKEAEYKIRRQQEPQA